MTTTTPTTAQECNDKLADLDLDKLEQQATMFRDIEGFHPGHFRTLKIFASSTLDLIALARRAAQPVAPVQDDKPVATVIKKGADRQWMSENLGSLPDGMYSLYLAPSPQIAEVAELPSLPKCDASYSGGRFYSLETMQQYARDAIAASRRAAADPQEQVLKFAIDVEKMLCATLGRSWSASGISIETLIAELATRSATPAPASAGRAAPDTEQCWTCFHCGESFTDREAAAIHFGTSERHAPICSVDQVEYRAMEKRMEAYNAEDAEIHREMHAQRTKHEAALRRAEEEGYAKGLMAAQPAEGAGQAGQVAKDEQEYFALRLKRVARAAGVEVFGEWSNAQVAECAVTILGEIARKLELAAPTERAEAPAEPQDLIDCEMGSACWCKYESGSPSESCKNHIDRTQQGGA